MTRTGVLTIGEAARLAGVTVRAVRHYHQRGLLPEPERDHSGYRRYDAGDVATLLRIRTLGEAGVPLARIADLLAATDEEFAAALAEVDADLRDRIRRLQQHRKAVARLPRAEELALPQEVVDYLAEMRALGIAEPVVALEREGWLVLAAQSPERVPGWIAQKRADLAVPMFRDLYVLLENAHRWSPDDPRLPALADRIADLSRSMAATWDVQADGEMDARMADLLDRHAEDRFPALMRLAQLLEERGFTGWTNISRTRARMRLDE